MGRVLTGIALAGATAALGGCSGADTTADASAAASGAGGVAARWAEDVPLPERRTEVSATTDGRYVYLAGGFGPPEGEERATSPRTLWRFDPAGGEWRALTEIPEGVHHAPFQHHEGRLYILGGFRETSFDPIGNVRIYDLDTDAWSEGVPMPTPRGAAGWAVLDGRIHVLGGNAAGAAAVEGRAGVRILEDRSVNVHEAYDPATDSWVELAPLPTPRNHLGATTAGGRIHAVLGRAEDDYMLTSHEIYDPATDTWSEGPPVPTGRSGVAVVEHEGHVYAFGGERLDRPNQSTFDAAERYDPRSGSWDELPSMPTARHGLGAAVVEGAIHVISGGPGPGFTFGEVHERLEVGAR